MDREILNAEAFIEIGDRFGDSVNDMCNFIANDKFNVLYAFRVTLAAS